MSLIGSTGDFPISSDDGADPASLDKMKGERKSILGPERKPCSAYA